MEMIALLSFSALKLSTQLERSRTIQSTNLFITTMSITMNKSHACLAEDLDHVKLKWFHYYFEWYRVCQGFGKA